MCLCISIGLQLTAFKDKARQNRFSMRRIFLSLKSVLLGLQGFNLGSGREYICQMCQSETVKVTIETWHSLEKNR